MVDFTSILNKTEAELPEPKVRPAGTYIFSIVGLPSQKTVIPKQGDKAGQELPVLVYKVKFVAATDDVDPAELADHPAVHEWGSPPRTLDFFLDTEGGQYFHSEWLKNTLGIEGGDRTIGERIAEAPGAQLLINCVHKPYTDRNGDPKVGLELGKTAHV